MGLTREIINIVILGCDSSHLESYHSVINNPKFKFYKKINIQTLWGSDFNQAKEKGSKLNILNIIESIEDVSLTNIDLVMVIGRYGSDHYLPAKYAIENKVFTFIDKPFTDNYKEALHLNKISNKNKTKIISFSPLKFCDEIKDINKLISTYKGKPYLTTITIPFLTNSISDLSKNEFSFYSIHSIEMALEIYKTVHENIIVQTNSNGFIVIIKLMDNNTVILNYPYKSNEIFSLNLFWENNHRNFNIDLDGDFYSNSLEIIYSEVVDKNNNAPLETALESVKIIDIIRKKLKDDL